MSGAADRQRMARAVYEEINKQQRSRVAAEERARTVEESRNRLLARELEAARKRMVRKPTLKERAVDAWAITWAVWKILNALFIEWGEAVGLWEVIRED